MLKDCKCSFNVVGGNVSLFDCLVGVTDFDNSNLPTNLDVQWLNSIYFDDEDLANSNVELIDIRVVPIWAFIPDEDIANMVEARVTGNLALSLDMLTNRNFINTSFDAHPASVTCNIGTSLNQHFDNPDVVDIIAANRHVATVCKEWVPEISTTTKVQVAYPIYEGKVKLTNGLCIHNGQAYKVDWRYGTFAVEQIELAEGTTLDGKIYMNCGVLSPVRSTDIEYQDSHAILGCERPGGIAIDGSLTGSMKKVFKHFGHFYLEDRERHDNLPGWEYSTSLPSEAANYGNYFDQSYQNRMVRQDSYVYMLNPTEISY